MSDPALQHLTAELAELFETALSVEPPAGLPDRWKAVLDRHGVKPDLEDDDDRYELAVRFGLARGAPPGEVKHCADAVIARFVAAEQATGRDPSAVSAVTAQLAHDLEESYLAYAMYRAKVITGDPIKSQHERTKMWARPPAGYVVPCTTCGGPRFDESIACSFCAAHLAE